MKNVTYQVFRTTNQVLCELDITRNTLTRYCNLLRRVTDEEEFDHKRYQGIYSPEAFEALQKVANFFRQGYHTDQIEEKITKEGI